MKKYVRLVVVSLMISLWFLMIMISPVFAFTIQTTITRTTGTRATVATMNQKSEQKPRNHSHQSNHQKDYQYLEENLDDIGNRRYWGSFQGNTGNRDYNGGYNQDNSSNFGNQIISLPKIRKQQKNKQVLIAQVHNSGNLDYEGYQQGNSGNGGYNKGLNQDDSGNAGNQLVN